jgi:hypothetical protein
MFVSVPSQDMDFQRRGLLCVQWVEMKIVRFVDTGGIVYHHQSKKYLMFSVQKFLSHNDYKYPYFSKVKSKSQ